jgi:hypothetical protein
MWLFTMHKWSWAERGYVYSHLPLENSQEPTSGQQDHPSAPGNMLFWVRPSQLPLTPREVLISYLIHENDSKDRRNCACDA